MLCVHGNPTWSLPVAAVSGRRARRLAGGGGRPAGHGLVGASPADPAAGRPDRRPRRPDRCARARRPRGHGRPRLGWPDLARLGAGPPRPGAPGWCWPTPRCTTTRASAPPTLIRLARTPRLRDAVCVQTPIFVRAAAALSRPALPADVRDALAAALRPARAAGGGRRLRRRHPAGAAIIRAGQRSTAIAAGVPGLADLPALLLWGARDPVFTEQHLADLEQRLPQADVQRYAAAAHLVTEDVPEAAEHVWRWVTTPRLTAVRARAPATEPAARHRPAGPRRGDQGPAVVRARDGRTERHQLRRAGGPGRRRSPAGSGPRRTPGRPGRAARPARHRSDRRGLRLLAGGRGHRGRRRRVWVCAAWPGRCAVPVLTT